MFELKNRNSAIDSLRGLAIFVMVAANMAAYNYEEPHSFLFRLYGSFAAPCFIFLSGILVPYTISEHKRTFFYYIQRGFLILFVAVSLDIFLWGLIPFSTFDVLYIIGISLPLNYFISRTNRKLHMILAVGIILVTPLVQKFSGYNREIEEISLTDPNNFKNWFHLITLKNFYVQGWFPVFPWLGISLLGSFMGRLRTSAESLITKSILLKSGWPIFIIGILSWLIINPTLFTREGYSELFYPPRLEYIFTYIGLIFILLALLAGKASSQSYSIDKNICLVALQLLGQTSLLMYILHTVFIVLFYKTYFLALDFFPGFLLLYFSHILVLLIIALLVKKLKERYKYFPFPIKFLLGS